MQQRRLTHPGALTAVCCCVSATATNRYKFGWNLKTDDLSLEYAYKALKFVAVKSPKDTIPRIGASFEHDWEL